MNRANILAVRLTEQERETAEALAAMERLPLSTLVRRYLLLQAESKKICPSSIRTNARGGAISGNLSHA